MQVALAGRTAQIVGPDGPIGRAIAAALCANGADLVTAPEPANILVVDARAGVAADAVVQRARDGASVMSEAGWGRIVLIVDVAGVVPVRNEMNASLTATALMQATRVLAMEFGGYGVLVNAVAAGPLQDEPRAARTASHVPLGRAPRPEDVANAVLFLIDPDNSYTTGHVLSVDGGWSAGFTRDF
jgi:NAD(P)-dependent dehydrogenase (short-subunit alcohol dehydrogenase family)